MSDVNTFIETIGKDVGGTVVPKVHDFLGALIQDVFQRYRPELVGELRTHIVNGGGGVTGQLIKIDVERRDTGQSVSTLDIPISITIRVDPIALTLQNTTI